MPKKSSKKSGGATFGYVDQFNFPLSPCYKPPGQPEIPRKGWHAGGAACDNQPTVSEMGIVDKPACNEPSASELAWPNRYSCPKADLRVQNGGSKKILSKLNNSLKNNQKTSVISINALKGGKEKIINIVNSDEKFVVSMTDKESNKSSFFETKSLDELSKKLEKYSLQKMNKSKKL